MVAHERRGRAEKSQKNHQFSILRRGNELQTAPPAHATSHAALTRSAAQSTESGGTETHAALGRRARSSGKYIYIFFLSSLKYKMEKKNPSLPARSETGIRNRFGGRAHGVGTWIASGYRGGRLSPADEACSPPPRCARRPVAHGLWLADKRGGRLARRKIKICLYPTTVPCATKMPRNLKTRHDEDGRELRSLHSGDFESPMRAANSSTTCRAGRQSNTARRGASYITAPRHTHRVQEKIKKSRRGFTPHILLRGLERLSLPEQSRHDIVRYVGGFILHLLAHARGVERER